MLAETHRAGTAECPRRVPLLIVLGVAMAAFLGLPHGADAARGAACTVGSLSPAQEARMLGLVNVQRRAAGRPALRFAPRLRPFARRTSIGIARGAGFRHDSMRWARGRAGAQNLAWTPGAKVAVRMFRASRSHRANMFNRRWRSMAVGAARDCRGRVVYTLNFSAAPRG